MEGLSVTFTTTEALPGWLGSLDGPLIVMPFIDAEMARRAARQLARRAGAKGRLLCVQDTKRVGFIAVANAVFRLSSAPQFGYLAQDAFAGRNWLKAALAKLGEVQGEWPGVLLALNDGKWNGMLAAFGLVDRAWARGNYEGDLFHPGYRSHYADAELTLIAMQRHGLRFDPLAMVIEVDWDKESKAVSDEDRIHFHRRRQTAFDRKVPNAGLRQLFS